MASQGGRPGPPVEHTLFEEPYRFGFFQAVRLMSRLDPERKPIGAEGRPGREWVRFRSWLSLSFPPSEVMRVRKNDDEGKPPVMTVGFLGLTGPLGVLPTAYTEFLMARRREKDFTSAEFFDLFNHRILSLLYRAWAKYRPALARESGGPEGDTLARCLFPLMGLGTPALQDRHDFSDDALLRYAGLFSQRRRPAAMLERLLTDHFGFPVEVIQFLGRWLTLDPADRSTLTPDGPHNGLGTSLMVGGRSWDVQGTFRLRLGPLTLKQFLALSPDGDDFRALAQMTRLYVDAELDFDVQLVLKAEEVPSCQVGGPSVGAQVGRTAWLKNLPMTDDADAAIFPGRR